MALGTPGSYEMWVKDAWLSTHLESNLTICGFKERLSEGRGQAALSDCEGDDSPSAAPFCPALPAVLAGENTDIDPDVCRAFAVCQTP